jgi:hypothetical protein
LETRFLSSSLRAVNLDGAIPLRNRLIKHLEETATRLMLVSDNKPDRFFTVIKFWMDETSGVVLTLKTGVPTYQVEDGLPRRRLAGGGRKAEFIY